MRVLITRPMPEAQELASILEPLGVETRVWPSLENHPVEEAVWKPEFLEGYQACDPLVFVSKTAARVVCESLSKFELEKLRDSPLFCMGAGTAEILKRKGFVSIVSPSRNSEGLLELDILKDLQGQQVWIFRAQEGRELLSQTLSQRGAKVRPLCVYERRISTEDPAPLIHAWETQGFDVAVVTSVSNLRYLSILLGDKYQRLLQKTAITVLSQTMLEWANRLGVEQTIWLESAQNSEVAKLLCLAKESLRKTL